MGVASRFSDNSSAGNATLTAHSGLGQAGGISFSANANAGNATLTAGGGYFGNFCGPGAVISFSGHSSAGNATITSDQSEGGAFGSAIQFSENSSAGNATLIANGGPTGGAVRFEHQSTGGTARMEVFGSGYLDIRTHQSGVTIGSIEGSGNVFLGANNLTVGTNGINTSFSGVISNSGGSLAKVGSGILTLENNHGIADTVGLILVSGSIINLEFTGASRCNRFFGGRRRPQPPGVYGGPMSGAPNILPEFAGSGTVSVGLTGGARALVADFNGDGHPDYVVQNASTHQTAIWYLNNNVFVKGLRTHSSSGMGRGRCGGFQSR